MSRYDYWPRYVPVAERRAKAKKRMKQLQKKGMDVRPVEIEGRKIAHTFWGKAWCDHIESFSDYANRLPRGRTYVRNGSVCHLDIEPGEISAMVSGSEIYNVRIEVAPLESDKWDAVRKRCAGRIGSILELLEGRFSENVMAVVTGRDEGLFPLPGEIRLECSCPDWATMCKHVASVLYGVGARLDEQPELLFRLRNVDPEELIQADLDVGAVTTASGNRRRISEDALGDVFGIEMDPDGGDMSESVSTQEEAAAESKTSGKSATREKPGETAAAKRTKKARRVGSKAKSGKNVKADGAKSKSAKSSKAAASSAKPAKSAGAADPKGKGSKSVQVDCPKKKAAKTTETAGNSAKRSDDRVARIEKKSRSTREHFPATGEAVARLRDDFDMTQVELAELLGVSGATISNWEKRPGRLNLQTRTQTAWDEVSRMTIDEAWAALEGE